MRCPAAYFSAYEDWPEYLKEAVECARGRVLDIGCGAGRHAIHLQEQGLDVLGIDTSPLAIEVCRKRGLRNAQVVSITQVGPSLGTFDTILMLGNNFGLFGSLRRARWLLGRFRSLTHPQALIVAESTDPYQTQSPEHLAYHQRNRARGRMPGQLRIRVRYRKCATPWFDYLLASKEEVAGIVEATGWEARRFLHGEGGRYVALIEKSKP